MFRVEDRRHGATYQVFTVEDPRKDGCKRAIEEGVSLDYDLNAVHSWPDGARRPEQCLGRDAKNPKRYKMFRYRDDLQAAGFVLVPGTTVTFGSWADYSQMHLIPPDPEQTPTEQWFDYLDRVDVDARERNRFQHSPDPPANGNRDDVAAWVAKKHLLVDTGIQQVWYLPTGAPPHEIRLLEVNERNGLPGGEVEALAFGLDVEGKQFELSVADINGEALESIKRDPSRLPPGWSLDGSKLWRRGA